MTIIQSRLRHRNFFLLLFALAAIALTIDAFPGHRDVLRLNHRGLPIDPSKDSTLSLRDKLSAFIGKGYSVEETSKDENTQTSTNIKTVRNGDGLFSFIENKLKSVLNETRKQFSSPLIVGTTFMGGLAAVSAAAKSGILRGPLDIKSGEFGTYTNALITQDIGSTFLSVILGYALVKLISLGKEKGFYGSKVSRKLSHTLSAPLFMLLFPFFSLADGSRFFAGLVVFTNIIRLYLAGVGLDPKLVASVSRSGDEWEVLRGPFIYVCVFQVLLLLFWRSSPIGVVAVSNMAAGDGMADLVGRRFGRTNKWWFSDSKSITGTVAFIISSTLASFGFLQFFMYTGFYQSTLGPMDLFLRASGISLACGLIELLPIGDDNYTVPLGAAILAGLYL